MNELAQMNAVVEVGSAGEEWAFWICGTLAVIGALGLVLSRKTVHSALFVALTMINLAVLYITLGAPFLGFVQIIVYTGAVMMLFLFVLMLIGVDSSDSLIETLKGQRLAAILMVLALGVIAVAVIAIALDGTTTIGINEANAEHGGNVEGLASLMFTKYLLAMEIVAAVLITAAMGALVLAHRERWSPKRGQRELAEERADDFNRAGIHPGSLPSPGVLATSNAVGTPAILPDGSASELSIPVPLRGKKHPDIPAEPEQIAADFEEVAELSESETVREPEKLADVTGHLELDEVYPDSHNDEAGTGEFELPPAPDDEGRS